jgi:RNA polymerase sigma-70 factor (ECF subfamily)
VDPFDEALLAAAQTGEGAALERLLSRIERLVYRFGLRMCGDASAAEAVLRQTLVAMAHNVGDFRAHASFSTWLYTLARSFCVAQARQLVAPVDLFAPPGDRAIDEAIAALPPDAREVLLLRDGEGLTAPEVAAVLELDVVTIKRRLHQARLGVRARVAPLYSPASLAPTPDCPDVAALLSQHLEDDLDDNAGASLEAHLGECARCRTVAGSLRAVVSRCRRGGDEAVPEAARHNVRRALRELVAS